MTSTSSHPTGTVPVYSIAWTLAWGAVFGFVSSVILLLAHNYLGLSQGVQLGLTALLTVGVSAAFTSLRYFLRKESNRGRYTLVGAVLGYMAFMGLISPSSLWAIAMLPFLAFVGVCADWSFPTSRSWTT